MEKFISTESKKSLLKLGLYQIIGGCLGILIFVWEILHVSVISGPAVILILIAIAFFAYSIYTGSQCIKMTEKALMHSFINQGMQILSFNMVGYTFKYVAGFYVGLGIDLTSSFRFTYGAGISEINISLFQQTQNIQIGINIIAIIIFVLVDRLSQKVKDEQEIRKDTRFL